MSVRAHFFRWAILTRKIGQNDLFLARDQGPLVALCMQEYKSLCSAVTICSTLVNIKTHIRIHAHTHTDNISTSLYEKLSQLSYWLPSCDFLSLILILGTHFSLKRAHMSISELLIGGWLVTGLTPDHRQNGARRTALISGRLRRLR